MSKEQGWMSFRNQTMITGIWDDHDYGKNDGFAHNNPHKVYT